MSKSANWTIPAGEQTEISTHAPEKIMRTTTKKDGGINRTDCRVTAFTGTSPLSHEWPGIKFEGEHVVNAGHPYLAASYRVVTAII